MLQSLTTPGQYHILQNADIPRADVLPLLIEPSAIEPYDTRSVWDVEECRCTHAIGNIKYSDIGWSVFCSCLQNMSIMQDPERRQPLRNTYHGWTTGKWQKSPMQPYINMRTISSSDQFTHILPLAISCIMTPRYYFLGTGICIPLVETSGGQEQYYIKSALHLFVWSFHV